MKHLPAITEVRLKPVALNGQFRPQVFLFDFWMKHLFTFYIWGLLGLIKYDGL